jgi:hypothetical protein
LSTSEEGTRRQEGVIYIWSCKGPDVILGCGNLLDRIAVKGEPTFPGGKKLKDLE